MSVNPLASKIATPYARALYDFSVEQNIMHQVTADFQNLEVFLSKTPNRVFKQSSYWYKPKRRYFNEDFKITIKCRNF